MSGYGPPTNDPWDAINQRREKEHQLSEEANRPGRTQTFQSVRKLWNAILDLRTIVDQLVELFNRMPQNDGRQEDTSGWSVNTPPAAGEWTTVATASIPRPDNMNRVAVMATANVAAIINDGGSSGGLQARLVISGSESQAVEGSAEYRGQQMRSAAGVGFFREFAPSSVVTVDLQVRGRMSQFTASNVAALSVSAGFTRVGS